ncbi:MAG: SMI1/KNR4 family protein [Saccharothrix sp.]|nr:SMI1/KNR4 family protein [Saccharothrix sp.]
MDIDTRLHDIAARLERLRKLDRSRWRVIGRATRRSVFGADHHQYRSEPLSEDQLCALERAMGVALPSDFRAFLHRIGTGAGPFYGISRFDALMAGATPDCAHPFPPAEQGPYFDDEGDEAVHGHLPIIDEGCGWEVYLITAGAHRGRVFTLDLDHRWTVGPDFLTHYEDWLDRTTRGLGR